MLNPAARFNQHSLSARLFAGALAALCLFSFAPDLRANEGTPDDGYQIGPENALQVDIYYGKGEKISQKVRVSSRGIIILPLLGEVEVTGLTVSGLQSKVTALLEKDYLVNPQVTVFIEEYSAVSIIGEVRRPGSYPIKGRLTILGLVALAEGLTPVAAPNDVIIIRTQADGTKLSIPVKVSNLIGKTNSQEDVVLFGGDVVVVPKSFF